MQQDHGMLMRAAAEHDINHVLLGHAVTLIEANMDPGAAQETISLIHAAISPGHAIARARGAMVSVSAAGEPQPEPEAAIDAEAIQTADESADATSAASEEDKPDVEPVTKPKAPRKTKPKA